MRGGARRPHARRTCCGSLSLARSSGYARLAFGCGSPNVSVRSSMGCACVLMHEPNAIRVNMVFEGLVREAQPDVRRKATPAARATHNAQPRDGNTRVISAAARPTATTRTATIIGATTMPSCPRKVEQYSRRSRIV